MRNSPDVGVGAAKQCNVKGRVLTNLLTWPPQILSSLLDASTTASASSSGPDSFTESLTQPGTNTLPVHACKKSVNAYKMQGSGDTK